MPLVNAGALEAGIHSTTGFHSTDEVIARGRRAATALAELGVRAGESAGFLLRNQVEWFEAWAAASALGAQPVLLNWHSRQAELEHILADSGTRVLIGAADLLARFPGLAGDRRVVSVGVPRLIEIRSHLPRDPSGKILKRELRKPCWAGRERPI